MATKKQTKHVKRMRANSKAAQDKNYRRQSHAIEGEDIFQIRSNDEGSSIKTVAQHSYGLCGNQSKEEIMRQTTRPHSEVHERIDAQWDKQIDWRSNL